MKNLNACLASLNLGLPDDVRRLKEAGYYTEAIARIDAYLAEDWTKTQNQPVQPGGPLPENPTPHGVDAMRDALLAQREILRRLPLDYTVPEAQALELLQDLVRDVTPEEFRALDRAGAMDWRFVEGEKRYIRSFAETLLATHPELAARQIDPPLQHPSWERYEPEHDQMGAHRFGQRGHHAGNQHRHERRSLCRSPCGCKAAGPQHRARPGVAAAPGGLPGTEQYHAGFLHRAADPHCTGRCRPAHGVLGGRPCREPALWRGVQLPYHGPLCRPAAHAGGPRAAGF